MNPVRRRIAKFGRPQQGGALYMQHKHAMAGQWSSLKNDCQFDVRNRLERNFVMRLECMPEVTFFTVGPEPLSWVWQSVGCLSHFPVSYHDRTRGSVLVEVKYKEAVEKHRLEEFSPAIRMAALAAGYSEFELWTDEAICSQPELANAEIISEAMRCHPGARSGSIACILADGLAALGHPVAIGRLHQALGEGAGTGMPALAFALIGFGQLEADLSLPLGSHTLVRAAGARTTRVVTETPSPALALA